MTLIPASDIISAILRSLDIPLREGDGITFGDPNLLVARVLLCGEPTMRILGDAAAGAVPTLIVSRGHPFYLRSPGGDGHSSINWSKGLADATAQTPLLAAKRAAMRSAHLVGYRLQATWDAARPASLSEALCFDAGWTPLAAEGTHGQDNFCHATIPPTPAEALARTLRARFAVDAVRLGGMARSMVTRVAIISGLADVTAIAAAVADPRVDGILTGDVCEWEGLPFVQDLVASGRRMTMFLVGHARSEEPSLAELAMALKPLSLPVEVLTDRPAIWFASPETQR